jgi:ABC-type multidrug transport system ATPase subunit
MPESSRLPLLTVRNITKRFGRAEVVSGVQFSVYAGELLGLIGPNGSGKTTLLDCLCGLQPADRHDVLWESRPLPPLRSREFL